MKRACYEWGWILSTGVAICCLGLWLATVISDRASGGLDLDGRNYVELKNGRVALANCGKDFLSPWSDIEDFFAYPVGGPPELTDHEFAIPGLRYLRIDWSFGDHDFYYAVEISLLIPGAAAAILGGLLWLLYWRFQRANGLIPKAPAT